MSARVNLVLEDAVKQSLDELVPAGRRSEFANQAIRTELSRLRRQRAIDQLAELRQRGPSIRTETVVQLLRDAREARE